MGNSNALLLGLAEKGGLLVLGRDCWEVLAWPSAMKCDEVQNGLQGYGSDVGSQHGLLLQTGITECVYGVFHHIALGALERAELI